MNQMVRKHNMIKGTGMPLSAFTQAIRLVDRQTDKQARGTREGRGGKQEVHSGKHHAVQTSEHLIKL